MQFLPCNERRRDSCFLLCARLFRCSCLGRAAPHAWEWNGPSRTTERSTGDPRFRVGSQKRDCTHQFNSCNLAEGSWRRYRGGDIAELAGAWTGSNCLESDMKLWTAGLTLCRQEEGLFCRKSPPRVHDALGPGWTVRHTRFVRSVLPHNQFVVLLYRGSRVGRALLHYRSNRAHLDTRTS